ncbi:MAG TPA: amidase family protein, partial [Polyangia bacterium]|nr:amidase family protein [Polyangia bacterium]
TSAYWDLLAARARYRARFLAALDAARLDAVVCPPLPLPALRHGTSLELGAVHTYTLVYNVTGMPAGVVAAARVRVNEESDRPPSQDGAERAARSVESGSAGLPVGVQVAARHWREDIVLAVMAALDQHFRTEPEYPVRAPL